MISKNINDHFNYQQISPIGNGGISSFLLMGNKILEKISNYFIRFSNAKNNFNDGCFYYGKLINQNNELIDEIILSIHSNHKVEIHSHGGKSSAKLIITFLETIGIEKLNSQHQASNNENLYYSLALNEIQTTREYNFLKNQIVCYQEIQNKINSLSIIEIKSVLNQMVSNYEIENSNRQRKHICLCGLPNAGKSSLLNVITGKNRAIVSNIERTTRDTVTENLQLLGHHIYLSDTAGLHQPDNQLDLESVAQAKKNINQADILIWLHDSTKNFSDQENAYLSEIKAEMPSKKMILCLTKNDLTTNITSYGYPSLFEKVFHISSSANSGISDLIEHIIAMLFPSANNTLGISALSQEMSNDIQTALIEMDQKVDLKSEKFTMYKDVLMKFLNTIPQVRN